MATLADKREELAAKAKALQEIFTEAGESVDLTKVTKITGTTAEKAAEIKSRNDQMTSLSKEVEVLQARDDQAQIQKYLDEPQGLTFPGRKGTEKTANRYEGKTIGDLFVDSPIFKSKRGDYEIDLGDPREGGVELKTLLQRTAWAIEPQRLATTYPAALRRPVVADLIPQATTNAPVITYMLETTTTNAVAAVAEGGIKPESALAFTRQNATVEKLATVLPVTDELFEDAPALRGYIEARLRLFLQIAEENAILSGTGTTPQIRGLLNFAGIQTQAKGTDPVPTAVLKAQTLIRANAFTEPSGIVMHPLDWQDVATLQSTTGEYLWGGYGNFTNAGPERIFGMPVVVTTAMTQNTALVGAFDTAAQIFRRTTVRFDVADQHASDFVSNLLMLRVEERLALACFRPSAFATVTGI